MKLPIYLLPAGVSILLTNKIFIPKIKKHILS